VTSFVFYASDFGERAVCFGTKISRRPNMRESSEKAPGPSRATATVKTMISSDDSNCPNAATTPAPIITTMATSGVINPTSKHAALTRLKLTTIQPRALTALVVTYATMCANNVKPTNARKRRRPMPGQLLGKAENSFCRTTLLQ